MALATTRVVRLARHSVLPATGLTAWIGWTRIDASSAWARPAKRIERTRSIRMVCSKHAGFYPYRLDVTVVTVVRRNRGEVPAQNDALHPGRVWKQAPDGCFHVFEPAVFAV